MSAKTKPSSTNNHQKQMRTGWLLLVVGVCAMLVGWFATADDFWRGATFGVGIAAVLVSTSYLFPKYIK